MAARKGIQMVCIRIGRRMWVAWGALAALGLGAGIAAALEHPTKNALTSLQIKECKLLKRHPDGNSYRCPGLSGYPVYFAEGDHRAFLSFGPGAAKRRAAEQTLGPFNTPFEKANERRVTIEWRVTKRAGMQVPHATIVRYMVSRDGARGQVLVVTRVTEREACHVAYIDAGANAEAIGMARKIADEVAPGFDCRHEPTIAGRPGILGG